MLYREILAVCSQIHTKHINTLCGQNVELLNVKLEVHRVSTRLYWVNIFTATSPLSYGKLLHYSRIYRWGGRKTWRASADIASAS
jgi:hypothetical protein